MPSPALITARLATSPEDIDLTLPLAQELHAEAHFSDIPYSISKRNKLLNQAIESPKTHALMIVEYKQAPIGFLFCAVGEYIVGTDALITTIYSFYVSKQFRGSAVGGRAAIRLLSGAIKWSQVRKAREIMVHVTSGINIQSTDTFLRKAGFKVLGANYALALDDLHD